MCERRIALANTVTEIAGFLCDVEEAQGCCGGPINGVLTGTASPMNTTSPSPPGFVWIGSINQLLVTQTLPDGSMDTPSCFAPERRCSSRSAQSADRSDIRAGSFPASRRKV